MKSSNSDQTSIVVWLISAVFALFALLSLVSCGPSPLAQKLEEQKRLNQVKKAEADTLPNHEDSTPVVVVKKTKPIVQDTVVKSKLQYPVAVRATVFHTVQKAFPKLSSTSIDMIVDNLMDAEVVHIVDNDVEEVVKAKVAELEAIGLIVNVSPQSPVNVSNRYKYKQSSTGKDSLIRLKMSWEKKN